MNTLEQINPIHILTARVNNLEVAVKKMEEAKEDLNNKMMQILEIRQSPKTKELIVSNVENDMGNSAEKVDRRYRVWQVLYENGFSASSIARAWGMDHKSVFHAKKNGWRSGYSVK